MSLRHRDSLFINNTSILRDEFLLFLFKQSFNRIKLLLNKILRKSQSSVLHEPLTINKKIDLKNMQVIVIFPLCIHQNNII